jgi:hypothetical protein
MFKLTTDFADIYKHQQITNSLFKVELFSPQNALFPKQVFRKVFDKYLFLSFNDWFDELEDYEKLHDFCQLVKEHFFYADAPSFYLLNPVKFSSDCTHLDFVNGFTYVSKDGEAEHSAKNIGLRLSPETFIYGESLTWAMLNDLTHNIIIVGLDDIVLDAFKSSFHGKYFDIHEVIRKLETFQGGKMDNAGQVIKTYFL